MRVVIAEDSVLLRAGLTRILADAGEEVVAAVDGRFTVSSPEGGPTIIRAELPCAS